MDYSSAKLTLSILLVLGIPLLPCSTMSYRANGETYVAKNYDFMFGDGMLVTNKRGLKKMGLLSQPDYMKYGAMWESRHGSITFNQFGRELPSGGMNEKGLVVELMWLLGTTKGVPEARPSVNELQWIQYQLDNYSSTREVVENVDKVQVIATASTLHYMVCDSLGECAVVEMLEGKPLVFYRENLKERVLTNTPYIQTSLGVLPGTVSRKEKGAWENSYERYNTLKNYISENRAERNPVNFGLNGLDLVKVRVPWYQRLRYMFSRLDPGTQWQIVYNTNKKEFAFRTKSNTKLRRVILNKFRYDCSSTVLVLDLDYDSTGDASSVFRSYKREDNERIIMNSTGKFESMPKSGIDFLVNLPEKYKCAGQ